MPRSREIRKHAVLIHSQKDYLFRVASPQPGTVRDPVPTQPPKCRWLLHRIHSQIAYVAWITVGRLPGVLCAAVHDDVNRVGVLARQGYDNPRSRALEVSSSAQCARSLRVPCVCCLCQGHHYLSNTLVFLHGDLYGSDGEWVKSVSAFEAAEDHAMVSLVDRGRGGEYRADLDVSNGSCSGLRRRPSVRA